MNKVLAFERANLQKFKCPGVGRKILNLRIEHYRNLQSTEVLKHMEIVDKSLVTRYVNIFKKNATFTISNTSKNRKIVFLIVIDYLQIINYYVLA